jgi:xylose dehydrogenase (NAD/NADP)
MMFGNLRWGILSTARVAHSLVEPIRQAARSELVGVASRDGTKAQAFAYRYGIPKAYESYEALLADPEIDVIYNALPNSYHCEWTVKAAKAGKHVLCEKPLVMSLAEWDAVQTTANTSNVIIFEGFKHLHHPQMAKVMDLIQTGRLGTLQFIHSCFAFYLSSEDKQNIRLDPHLGGGALWDAGVYANSLIITLAGDGVPVEVWANQIRGETGVDISLFGQMRFASGVIAQLSCSFRFPYRYQSTLIVGSNGSLQISEFRKPDDHASRLILATPDNTEEVFIPGRNPYLCEVEAMEACLLDGAEPVVPLRLSRDFLRSVLVLYESANTGRAVSICN